MKKLFWLVALMALSLFVTTILVIAQEDPSENACYAGGAWDGKCDWPTDAEDAWAWTCGWYYAGVLGGKISAQNYPETCASITKCTPVADVFYVDTGALTGTIPASGVLANDIYAASCTLTSFSAPVVIAGGGDVTSLTVSSDGAIEYAVTQVGTTFTFSYTTSDGASATVTIYHD